MFSKRNLVSLFTAIVIAVPTMGVAFAQQKPTAPASPAAKAAKKMPARDPKTGRFMKSGSKMGSGKMAGGKMVGAKKPLPPRDAKGRFMKKGAMTPPASPAAKTP